MTNFRGANIRNKYYLRFNYTFSIIFVLNDTPQDLALSSALFC